MKQGSTLFLKGVVILLGLAAITLCVLALSAIGQGRTEEGHALLVGMHVTVIPFLIALYQAFKLLNYIDKNKAFSELSVRALRNIKYCAIIISGLVVAGILYVALFLEGDRAGTLALGIYITFGSIVIATFAAVLQKLLQNAVDIKSENDLTV